jgi:hypothetical protein
MTKQKKDRCRPGYEPVPGKKPYSKGDAAKPIGVVMLPCVSRDQREHKKRNLPGSVV